MRYWSLFGLLTTILLVGCTMSPEEIEEQKRIERQQAITDSVARVQRIEREDSLLTEQLKREVETFGKPFDNSSYNGSVESIQLAIVLFNAWGEVIKKGENSPNVENNQLAKKLKSKVASLQKKEYPIMRKRYCEVLSKLFWEHDISVNCVGNGNRIISFAGGTFATNKNIKDFQTKLHSIMLQFRFTQSRYRWYKGQDEYTYYDINCGKDIDIVNI